MGFYDKFLNFKKAGLRAVAVALLMVLAQGVQAYLSDPDGFTLAPGLLETLAAGLLALAYGLWVSVGNWWKNSGMRGAPKWWIFGVALMAITLQGCYGLTPAGGGKTISEQIFESQQPHTIADDGSVVPGEKYYYKSHTELPAGVELTNQNAMSAGIDPDSGWSINVGAGAAMNTQGQANMLTEMNRQNIESMQAILNMALQIAGPLVGQRLTNDAAATALKFQDRAAMREQLMVLLQDPALREDALEVLTRPGAVGAGSATR